MTRPRVYRTANLATISSVFLAQPTRKWDAPSLVDQTGLRLWAVYAVLHRMKDLGWLSARGGKVDGKYRVFYRLTDLGETETGRMLS